MRINFDLSLPVHCASTICDKNGSHYELNPRSPYINVEATGHVFLLLSINTVTKGEGVTKLTVNYHIGTNFVKDCR